MKKFILPLAVTLCSQMIAPAMAQPGKQVDLNAVLLPAEGVDIWVDEGPKMDWAVAQEVCRQHVFSMESGSDGSSSTTYESQFEAPCHAVEAHFDEEEHRKEVAEQIQRDAQSAKDLNRLTDFLAGGTAK